MSKQQPLISGDICRLNVGDSAYFGPGRRRWVRAVVDRVLISGNSRRYDLTAVDDGSKHYGVHALDVKKNERRP